MSVADLCRQVRTLVTLGGFVLAGLVFMNAPSSADEGGVGFWLPGSMGSLAAVPGEPGLSWATIYFHSSVKASGGQEFPSGGEIRAGLDGDADLVLFGPSYAFEEPILGGGQLSLSLLWAGGHSTGAVSAELTGPGGNAISGALDDSVWGVADLFGQATVKWHDGVNNYMTYVMSSLPVGTYDEDALVNIGLGHSAIDGGLGYTYFNSESGLEFSAIGGLTYNFENEHTHYQNGIDGHIDLAASVYTSQTAFVGAAGYLYQQLTGDSGDGATLGDFKSRVAGVGPQVGFFFPVADKQGYLNIKAFYEFDEENRAAGWNAWVTFAISPAAPH